MNLLPYENITYHSDLSVEEVMMRLNESVEPKKWLSFGNREKPYQGEVNDLERTFEISRIINYRNSFLPQISGRITESSFGTEVKVKMKLHPLVLIFIIIWLGFTGVIGSFSTIMLLSSEDIFHVGALVPLGMFVFGSVVTIGAFKWESAKSKEFLESLLEVDTKKKQEQGFSHFKK